MCHVSDLCASSPQPLDQTIIRWMVEMEWIVLPCMPSYLEQTTILRAKSSTKHMQPTFVEAVRAS